MDERDEKVEQIASMLAKKEYAALRQMLDELQPVDVAILLGEMPQETLPVLFRLLNKDSAAETFVEMESDEQELLLHSFSDAELREVLDELYLDDTVDIIEEMPANVVTRILQNSTADMRKAINAVLQYPADSAGSIMTIEFVRLNADMTVEDAFKRIRRTGVDKETIYTCYVTDKNRKLLGVVTAKTLLLSDMDDAISNIMETNIISVGTHDDKEDVARVFDKYGFLAVPVVDGENRLVGIVTVDDAMDIIQEETTEDFAKMAAISASDDEYFKTPVWKHAKNRFLWLLILMLSATATGYILEAYETAFAALPLLVTFIPMIMGTGGNCGAQSATMIIRGLALEEITPSDFLRAWFKEARIALMVGIGLAVVNFFRVWLLGGEPVFGVITGLTLIGTALLAKSLGCILPMLAKKLRLDPAIMASPLITTIVDACSMVLYFSIAVHVLGL